jgi:hypothetical protein
MSWLTNKYAIQFLKTDRNKINLWWSEFIEHNISLTKLIAKPMDIYTSKASNEFAQIPLIFKTRLLAWLEITCLSYLAAQIQNNEIQLVNLCSCMSLDNCYFQTISVSSSLCGDQCVKTDYAPHSIVDAA